MTYNPGIPLATDLISVSQGDLLNNFSALNTIFAEDHFTWNDETEANRGLHKQVTLPIPLSADPSVSGTQSQVYSKTISGVAELFFANATSPNVMWRGGTGSGLVTQVTGAALSNGYMILPNGITFQWGSSAVTDNMPITFPIKFNTACFGVQITILRNNNDVRSMYLASAPTQLAFTPRTSATSNIACVWFAIGN